MTPHQRSLLRKLAAITAALVACSVVCTGCNMEHKTLKDPAAHIGRK
jgi:hypothetical protein